MFRERYQVTAGKIYLEIERARLVKKLASMKEQEGLVSEAAEIMMEVAVETFGAMARTEKIYFIIEQIRLLLENKDYVRAQIYCKKINPRSFSGELASRGGYSAQASLNTGPVVNLGSKLFDPPLHSLFSFLVLFFPPFFFSLFLSLTLTHFLENVALVPTFFI